MRIAVVGAGVAGLSAAHTLAKHRHEVVVFEAAPNAGGLASGFRDEGWEWSLERFYHHWFRTDQAVIDLIGEIGRAEKLFFPRPTTSMWHQGRAYPFDNYVRALLYPHLTIVDKMRAGPVAVYLRLTRDWRRLEQHTADAWLRHWMGDRGYRELWQPLIVGKFGDYYRDVNMAWFWARLYKRSSRLGYFVGGFQAFVDALAEHSRERGVEVRLGTPVTAVRRMEDGGQFRLDVGGASVEEERGFDRVVLTTSPDSVGRLAPDLPADYVSNLRNLRSMGATVLILALKHRLTDGHYWVNLPKDEGFPFLALVEHTNFVDASHYGGDHLVYCGDYLKPDHEYFSLTREQMVELFLPSLKRFNSDFRPDWVRRSWMFRETYAQPVPGLNHSHLIPDLATPIPGLFWASMSHVYPWDRGTNYAVEFGQAVARRAMAQDAG